MAWVDAEGRVDPAEYLILEEGAEERSQFLDGRVFAMAGGSPAHETAVSNLTAAVMGSLRGSPCRAFTSNTRVKVEEGAGYLYPDLTVVCGNPRWEGSNLVEPAAVFEVLSPSTEGIDRGPKFRKLVAEPTLRYYVLVSTDEEKVEVYGRLDDRTWSFRVYGPEDGTIPLPLIDCQVALTDLYAGVDEARSAGDSSPEAPA